MENKLKLSVSPHIHSGKSTAGIMRDVLISLLPATIAGTVIFGARSLLVVAVCVAACVGFEALFNVIVKKDQTIGDFSAAVTGLLLALNLSANIPLWQCVIGSLFAIVVVKCLFGGIGCNPVNPAITARVFMLVAFSSVATKQAFPKVVDTVSSATPLSLADKADMPSLVDLFLGLNGGAIGETCVLALVLGFVYLLARRVITWHVPVAFIGTVFVCSFFKEYSDVLSMTNAVDMSSVEIMELGLNGTLEKILSGGLFIGAIFMATDYVTSPSTAAGKLIFGVGAGLVTFVIRYFGNYPEGVSFAILFMNILTPYIDSWTRHKVFGVGGKKA